MPVWEYKVISSGKGGFATPALLESFLNQLGKEDWEIIHYQSPPDNPLAFHGLARRSTLRDWTLEDAAAAAARAETEKLRAEFEAKFRGLSSGGAPAGEEKPEAAPEAKPEPEDGGYRKPRNTDRDLDSDAEEEDEWDQLTEEEELPTFFEAIQPLMRRNPKGAGMSVGVDQLAKKWHMAEEDVLGALKECGFAIPEDEDARPEYVEFDGDLFWVNVNRRGELWVNTKEKPRPVFRVAQGNKVAPDTTEAAPPSEGAPAEGGPPQETPAGEAAKPSHRLPEGEALLKRIRPMMRRGRGGASGSFGFLSRALKCRESDLIEAFQALGLSVSDPGASPSRIEIGDRVWWLNKDQRGAIWINEGRRDRGVQDGGAEAPAEGAPPEAPAASEAAPAAVAPSGDVAAAEAGGPPGSPAELQPASETPPAPEPASAEPGAAAPTPAASTLEGDELLSAVRPLLKETRSGGLTGEICTLAESLGRNPEHMLQTFTALGLRIPDKPRDKAVEVERSGSVYWLTRNAKDEIWFNVREAGAEGEERKPRRGRRPAAAAAPSEPTPTE